MNKTNYVMDYETLTNCFVGVFIDYKENKRKVFIIHDLKDDREEFYNFLKKNVLNKEIHISFNGLNFDSQITHWYLDNYKDLKHLSASEVANKIYKFAQYIIDEKDKGNFLPYSERNMIIPQVDIYRINHWDSNAKRASLKWIEFTTRWWNLQDMPIEHTATITKKSELIDIVNYCTNDVLATKHVFKLCYPIIKMRLDLSREFEVNILNSPEPKIVKTILLKLLSEDLGISPSELKTKRTYRESINIKDIIFPFISFKNPILNDVLNYFNKLTVYPPNLKGVIDYAFNIYEAKIKIGLGGIHGATTSGVYESDDEYIIKTSDVKSYYPNICIQNELAPAHIDKHKFVKRYKWFYTERQKYPKSNPINYLYKIILNSAYGLTNEENNFLYDPLVALTITINGQLMLLMLTEMLINAIPNAQLLLLNTDGLEMKIPKKYEKVYHQICDEWCEKVKLILEHDVYDKLIIADVNSYIAVNMPVEVSKEEFDKTNKESILKLHKDNKYYLQYTKCKGRLEIEDIQLHKNQSNLVSRKAIFNFFLRDISVEKYINEHKDIFDFLIAKRATKDFKFQSYKIINNELEKVDLQKTIRYVVSKSGSVIYKIRKNTGSEERTEAGIWHQTVHNIIKDQNAHNYDIDKRYYVKQAYNEINNIVNNQLKLL